MNDSESAGRLRRIGQIVQDSRGMDLYELQSSSIYTAGVNEQNYEKRVMQSSTRFGPLIEGCGVKALLCYEWLQSRDLRKESTPKNRYPTERVKVVEGDVE